MSCGGCEVTQTGGGQFISLEPPPSGAISANGSCVYDEETESCIEYEPCNPLLCSLLFDDDGNVPGGTPLRWHIVPTTAGAPIKQGTYSAGAPVTVVLSQQYDPGDVDFACGEDGFLVYVEKYVGTGWVTAEIANIGCTACEDV